MNKHVNKTLLKCWTPIDPRLIETRKVGRMELSYYPGYTVIDRLNQVYKNGWSFVITDSRIVDYDGETAYVITGELSTSDGMRSAVGVGVMSGNKKLSSNADAFFKGAVTDCLKKCASYFGIAAELYPQSAVARFKMVDKTVPKLSSNQGAFAQKVFALHDVVYADDKDEYDLAVTALLKSHEILESKDDLTADNYEDVMGALIDLLPVVVD